MLFIYTDKPMRPTGPLKPVEIRADHITVEWKKPEDNGGSEISGYVIEKMDLDNGRWVPAGEVCMIVYFSDFFNQIKIILTTKYFFAIYCI